MEDKKNEIAKNFVYSKWPHLKHPSEGENPIVDFTLTGLCDLLEDYKDSCLAEGSAKIEELTAIIDRLSDKKFAYEQANKIDTVDRDKLWIEFRELNIEYDNDGIVQFSNPPKLVFDWFYGILHKMKGSASGWVSDEEIEKEAWKLYPKSDFSNIKGYATCHHPAYRDVFIEASKKMRDRLLPLPPGQLDKEDGCANKTPTDEEIKQKLRQIYRRYDGSHWHLMLDSIQEFIKQLMENQLDKDINATKTETE